MKINNDGPNITTGATDPLTRTSDQSQPGKVAAETAQDLVRVSPEARMIQALAEQAAQPPAIRQDVVDRMRALLDKGQIGADPGALADSMIDDGLKS